MDYECELFNPTVFLGVRLSNNMYVTDVFVQPKHIPVQWLYSWGQILPAVVNFKWSIGQLRCHNHARLCSADIASLSQNLKRQLFS